ncbi:hypothetical protein B5F79_06215 [Olsenella sp. An285]|nr:hypothetical protein B5F79_06215 [Olsenella sp. An285]
MRPAPCAHSTASAHQRSEGTSGKMPSDAGGTTVSPPLPPWFTHVALPKALRSTFPEKPATRPSLVYCQPRKLPLKSEKPRLGPYSAAQEVF